MEHYSFFQVTLLSTTLVALTTSTSSSTTTTTTTALVLALLALTLLVYGVGVAVSVTIADDVVVGIAIDIGCCGSEDKESGYW
jgi:hypothetical protein